MCGIVFALRSQHPDKDKEEDEKKRFENIWNDLCEINSYRGPDIQSTYRVTMGNFELYFYSSVLHLRGDKPVKQPHVGESGDVFCWNGEIFEGLEIDPADNDGSVLFSLLQSQLGNRSITSILTPLEAPFAFVHYDKSSNKLYFARDPIGRRSLLLHKPTLSEPWFLLSSVSPKGKEPNDGIEWEEVGVEGVWYAGLAGVKVDRDSTIRLRGFTDFGQQGSEDVVINYEPRPALPAVNRALPPSPTISTPTTTPPEIISQFTQILSDSVRVRVIDIPTIGQRKEGDARVGVLFSGGIDCAVIAYLAHLHIPIEETIDLLNVAFENPRSLSAKTREREKGKKRKVKRTALEEEEKEEEVEGKGIYMVPDRETGLEELEELKSVCPGRAWNFVEVDVSYEESCEARPIVEGLMYPSRTVMDLSLAQALYFASRAVGNNGYRSTARVLLSGLGSDELLGGYARYRTIYNKDGWTGVVDELQLDLSRLPSRNLGRDDRTMSHHAKEVRYPYLSSSVITFLASLPAHIKLDPVQDGGEKRLLRQVSASLGLVGASTRKKRALQFGSRSARMEKGTDVLNRE